MGYTLYYYHACLFAWTHTHLYIHEHNDIHHYQHTIFIVCTTKDMWFMVLFTMAVVVIPFLVPILHSPLLCVTSGSSWLYVKWNAQSATFRVLYRESGASDYQVIVSTTSQLSHNISALQPNTLYNIVVEAKYNETLCEDKVNSSVTTAYTTPNGEQKSVPMNNFWHWSWVHVYLNMCFRTCSP